LVNLTFIQRGSVDDGTGGVSSLASFRNQEDTVFPLPFVPKERREVFVLVFALLNTCLLNTEQNKRKLSRMGFEPMPFKHVFTKHRIKQKKTVKNGIRTHALSDQYLKLAP
jgi:hypothetical protein